MRPREKLISQGAPSLSDAELIAIFIRVGTRDRNALELSGDLLRQTGGIRQLLLCNINDLGALKGLGISKWSQLQAAKEIVKRSLKEHLESSNIINSPGVTREFLQTTIGHLPYEVFVCLYLNASNEMIGYQEIFRGTATQTPIYPKEIVKEALNRNAVALVVAHNHPSGNPLPSQDDLNMTDILQKSLEMLDIQLYDHCIITSNGFFSFADAGIMKNKT
jgi:DNA repair protein RadC